MTRVLRKGRSLLFDEGCVVEQSRLTYYLRYRMFLKVDIRGNWKSEIIQEEIEEAIGMKHVVLRY